MASTARIQTSYRKMLPLLSKQQGGLTIEGEVQKEASDSDTTTIPESPYHIVSGSPSTTKQSTFHHSPLLLMEWLEKKIPGFKIIRTQFKLLHRAFEEFLQRLSQELGITVENLREKGYYCKLEGTRIRINIPNKEHQDQFALGMGADNLPKMENAQEHDDEAQKRHQRRLSPLSTRLRP